MFRFSLYTQSCYYLMEKSSTISTPQDAEVTSSNVPALTPATGTPATGVAESGKATTSSKMPLSVQEQKTGGALTKEPGWRLSSSSKVKLTRPRSGGEGELTRADGCIKSDTSISSNGPLKEFYRTDRSRIKHQPKVRFDPNPKLVKEAVQVSATLETLPIPEQQRVDEPVPKKGPSGKLANNGKQASPYDPYGGYLGNSLEHVKLVTYYDNEDVEKSNRSNKSNAVTKSTSSKRGKQQLKTAQPEDSAKKGDQ